MYYANQIVFVETGVRNFAADIRNFPVSELSHFQFHVMMFKLISKVHKRKQR